MSDWFRLDNDSDVASPALLIYPERVRENIHRMIQLAGGPERLRPHLKTHKLAEIVRMQLDAGITKFKCATIAEAEMAAAAGALDVLLAYPVVGPNAARLLELAVKFPATRFSCLADTSSAMLALGEAFHTAGRTIEVLLDVDCGQKRTGVEPGDWAIGLYQLLTQTPGLKPGGLHVYDGHLSEANLEQRTALCEAAFIPVNELRRELLAAEMSVPRVVAGGTPTFPIHARNPDFECSPGTCVLWDFGYGDKFLDLPFLHAALVLTRVVSKPGVNRLCLDLGHKAIAAENPPPRVRFLNLPGATAVAHSEEHLVVEGVGASEFAVGDCLYGVPRHVCPTVALYSECAVVEQGHATGRWPVTARARRLTV